MKLKPGKAEVVREGKDITGKWHWGAQMEILEKPPTWLLKKDLLRNY